MLDIRVFVFLSFYQSPLRLIQLLLVRLHPGVYAMPNRTRPAGLVVHIVSELFVPSS